ncbi:MAG: cell wall metabolism sensor histidine kinase WalK, partial [Epulopiscium sp.]|nr:cell wall metabolism sensor histidine kinase WalK [Candidatus Epulonipiscium sp.]
MRKKLFWSYTVLVCFISLVLGSILFVTEKRYYEEQIQQNVILQIQLLKSLFEESEPLNPENFVKQYRDLLDGRITIIDSQGVVIADSDADFKQMKNHLYREEVQKALEEKVGISTRYSDTLQTYFLYGAIMIQKQEFIGTIRLAKSLNQIQQINRNLILHMILWTLFGIVLSFFIAYFMSYKILSPIRTLNQAVQEVAKGNYNKKIYIESSEEDILHIRNAFNHMTEQLQNTIFEIKDKNMKLEMVLSGIQTGIIAVDFQYRIILINSSCYSLLNIENQEVEGQYFYNIIHDQDVWDILDTTLKNREVQTKKVFFYNEKESVLQFDAYPILPTWTDQIMGALLIIQDITQLHQLENFRKDFVSNVSHELKTPLTSIRGFIETLQEGALENPKVARRFLDIIDLEAERLYSLIQDILLLSEIENREQEQEYFYYEWIDIIQEVVQLLQPKVQKKGLDLVVDLSPSLPPFYCNKDRIKQMVINILDNAIHYTEKGAVGITCFFHQDQFYIQIWDTGIGIPQEHIPRLFERFYRVDKGRSRNKGGTG